MSHTDGVCKSWNEIAPLPNIDGFVYDFAKVGLVESFGEYQRGLAFLWFM